MAGGADCKIPLVIINGKRKGPVLNLHAGIHGDEYEGIRAIWRIAEEVDSKSISGTIVATPIVHMAAYAAGMRESPVDGKNLARVFPGDRSGTATDRLAYHFFNEVVMKSDYTLGLHSGGFRYRFHPLVEYYHGVKRSVEEKARNVAFAFAIGPFDIVERIPLPPRNVTCTYAASMAGVPGVEPEMWGEGRCLPEHVDQYFDSVMNVLARLEMIESKALPHRLRNVKPKFDHTEGSWALPEKGGLFQARVGIREEVRKNQIVGVVLDDFGEVIEELKAPADGFVGAMRTFSMIRPGDWGVQIQRPLEA